MATDGDECAMLGRAYEVNSWMMVEARAGRFSSETAWS